MIIYSTKNIPIGYYVYLYLRNDGTPYYVGKGIRDRAWKNHRRNGKGIHTPSDPKRISSLIVD